MFYHEKLHCYQRAKALIFEIAEEIRGWPTGYGFLVDQLKRASSSVLLNLAEGNNRRSLKERRRFFDISKASAAEVAAILDVAGGFGIISSKSQMEKNQETLEIVRMIAKL